MKFLKLILILFFVPVLATNAQTMQDSTIVGDLFEKYVDNKLALTRQESMQMRPLVRKYIVQRKKITRLFPDPLEREKQIITLKLKYRDQFTPIIGQQRANAFFIHEQSFRRKIKEELRKRRLEKRF